MTSPEALREAVARATANLSNTAWTPRRAHYEGMRNQLAAAEAALQEARADAVAFCAPWAAVMARNYGLPDGHLFPEHYDILERNGARMVAFTRHEPDRALSPGGAE